MTKGYEQRKEANKRYMEKLEEIKIRFPKGRKDSLKEHAAKQGESLNAFIIRAIDETMQRDILQKAYSDSIANGKYPPSRLIR